MDPAEEKRPRQFATTFPSPPHATAQDPDVQTSQALSSDEDPDDDKKQAAANNLERQVAQNNRPLTPK